MSRRNRRNEFVEREPIVEVDDTPKFVIEAEEPEVEVVDEPVPEVKGKVACEKLNVRMAPSTDAPVMTIIKKGDEVVIDMSQELVDWYAVKTSSQGGISVEGFVMSKYIEKE